MGRIGDLIPALYLGKENELEQFLCTLEPEIETLEKKIAGIPDLSDVDRCDEKYLPYLAALTNCPLIGEDPRLWRRQIRNWPWVLKIKGTERSLEVFLNSIDTKDFKLSTWFRDAWGNYTEEKPLGEPVYNEADKLWYNIRTHYFSLDIVLGEQYVSLYRWSAGELIERIRPWLERAKPFHAELLDISIIPPELEFHGCRYDVCAWGHGLLPTTPLDMGGIETPFDPEIDQGLTRCITVLGVYERFPRYDVYRLGYPLPEVGQWNCMSLFRSVHVDRRSFGIWRGWHRKRRWSDGGTWGDMAAKGILGIEGGMLSTFTKSAAVWGHARYDGLEAMEPRTWNVPDAGRHDEAIYAGRDGGGAEWVPIDEYRILPEQETLSLVAIWSGARAASGEVKVLSEVEDGVINRSHMCSGALCHSGRGLYTARERRWDNVPWDNGTWSRAAGQHLLSRLADATITTITKEEGS